MRRGGCYLEADWTFLCCCGTKPVAMDSEAHAAAMALSALTLMNLRPATDDATSTSSERLEPVFTIIYALVRVSLASDGRHGLGDRAGGHTVALVAAATHIL